MQSSQITSCTEYPHHRRLMWPYVITRLTANFMCGLIWWFASLEKYGYTWHWMSLLRMQTQPTFCVKWPCIITRLTASFVCGLIWWFASLEKYGYTWHRMSLLKTQTQPTFCAKWPCICNHQADSQLYVWSDLVICKFRKVWLYMTPNALTENANPTHILCEVTMHM